MEKLQNRFLSNPNLNLSKEFDKKEKKKIGNL